MREQVESLGLLAQALQGLDQLKSDRLVLGREVRVELQLEVVQVDSVSLRVVVLLDD